MHLNIDTNKKMIPHITLTPIPLNGASIALQIFGQRAVNRSRNDRVYDDNLDKAEILNSSFIRHTQLSGVPPLLPDVINPQYPSLKSIA